MRACGKGRWLGTTEALAQDIRRVSDADFWQMRNATRKSFVAFVRQRISLQFAGRGASPEAVDRAKHLFDPNALTPRFSANRTVREYVEQHYLSAAAAYRERAADQGVMGRRMVDWRHALEGNWCKLRVADVNIQSDDEQHVFEVPVYLCDLDPGAVRVELYADGLDGAAPLRHEMTLARQLAGAPGVYVYSASASAARPPGDYTVRVIPHYDGVAVPLEETRILWQR
jgi:hypothetical protein